ncbi:hypothetical protein Tco_0730641 [Tanacetum coccineum]|uniref:Uncharacterized protein n=1 Tax=Tanacetum coccineum TaxID=301880 RepID=A0ABQ4YSQ1_9ASTR
MADKQPISHEVEENANEVHLKELEDAAKSPNYALMWLVLMSEETKIDNEFARKLLDAVSVLDKNLSRRMGIIDELKNRKGIKPWKASTFFEELQLCEKVIRAEMMTQINEANLRTFEKKEFVEAMKKLEGVQPKMKP